MRVREMLLDANDLSTVPSAIFLSCAALQTLSLHGNPITEDILVGVEGCVACTLRSAGTRGEFAFVAHPACGHMRGEKRTPQGASTLCETVETHADTVARWYHAGSTRSESA